MLDKVSQYIIREVIEKGPQDPIELVFRITLFNIFTKVDTWELLHQELGSLTWATYSREDYKDVLSRAKRAGAALYTGAFIKPAPSFGYADNFMNHLCLLETFMENDLPAKLLATPYMADIYEYLVSFPSMGEFSTFQLLLNLSYSSILKFSGMDFVVSGPGASSGLYKMFGHSIVLAKRAVPGFEVDVMRWIAKTQNEHFKRLGLDFSGLGPGRLPMELADIEHTLCEVDKYSRIAHPGFKGKRTEIRRNFVPTTGIYPCTPCFPKAWSDPDRATLRVRPGGPPVVEKRYEVSRIGGRRKGPKGVEYLVYWYGYRDDESTWEPEERVLMDAGAAVEDFLTHS